MGKINKLRVFEAFAGIGCQSIALRNLGINFEVVGIMEVDRYALLGYDAIHNSGEHVNEISKDEMINEVSKRNILYNFTTGKSEIPKNIDDLNKVYKAHIRNKNYGDIRLINPNDLPDFDLFTYSFPCKNISVEGKQDSLEKDSGTASSLMWECLKIIEIKRPKYLLMENVKNILAYNHKPHFDKFCNILESYGYVNHYDILNSLNFGLPSNRERCMMFSVLKEYDKGQNMPKGERTDKKIFDILDNNHNHKFDLKGNEMENFLEMIQLVDGKLRVPNGTKLGYLDMNIPGVFDFNRIKSKTRRGRVKENGVIAGTVTASEPNFVYVELKKGSVYPRKLSSLELWRLLGHSDDDFYKCEDILPERKLRERAGRSIAIPMLEEIFKVYLEDYVNEKDIK